MKDSINETVNERLIGTGIMVDRSVRRLNTFRLEEEHG